MILREDWLYLAIVKDLFDRQIVGCATGNRIDADLCKRALSAAVRRYKSDVGLIHHSDQGAQYASRDYQELLRQYHIARAAIFEYIEIYYNRQRRNASVGNVTPAAFRRRFYQQPTA